MWMSAKSEMEDLQQEFDHQIEGLEDIYHGFQSDIQLCNMILSAFFTTTLSPLPSNDSPTPYTRSLGSY